MKFLCYRDGFVFVTKQDLFEVSQDKKEKMTDRVKMGMPPATASINCLISWIGCKGDFEAAHIKAEKMSKSIHGWRRYTSVYTAEGNVTAFLLSIALVPVYYYGAKYFMQRRKMTRNKEIKNTTE